MLANIKHSISVFNEQFFDVYENSSNCEKCLCLAWVQFANSQKDHRKLTVWETKLTESSQQAHCELILWAHSELIKCPQNELTVTPPGELSVSFVWAFSELAVSSHSSLGKVFTDNCHPQLIACEIRSPFVLAEGNWLNISLN